MTTLRDKSDCRLACGDKTSPEEYEYSSDGESEVEPAQEDHNTLSNTDIDNTSVEGDKDRYTSIHTLLLYLDSRDSSLRSSEGSERDPYRAPPARKL
ncbi:hypothetical protein PGT21_014293 [Puccinia graminis f. sp. tritici]|uniref:Uncharacterized protein n=1 Tax=Puccinia graminis f. sp. tritici TaxID=56615 RepID=A0A5B0M2D9_PUCGR|nr:hypothetical protein PGT21_014293 [Puccinia graminis f. sp. tritici]